MDAPFRVMARCEYRNVSPGAQLWASVEVEAAAGGLERERAPMAVVLVADVSGSMRGEPLAHLIESCEILAGLLGERDQLSIVTFADEARVLSGLSGVNEESRGCARKALATVRANGQTNLFGGASTAAGVLMTAPAGLRRVMVVMSDGQPNVGISSADALASYVTGIGVAVSSLGFGLAHDENVLDAIARAGSGRYAYIPDPATARVDLARTVFAHGGIVADQLELQLEPADGVEVIALLPARPMRIDRHGARTAIGDVFVDEGRTVAIEMRLDPSVVGRLAAIAVSGRSPDGVTHRIATSLDVDVRNGPSTVDRDAQRHIVIVRADAVRGQARAQADRGAMPAASALLRQATALIDATEGFVRNDGSPLAELREQLEDEAANCERKSTELERVHQRKAGLAYRASSPREASQRRQAPAIPACLIGVGGSIDCKRFDLFAETTIGRSSACDIFLGDDLLSRSHARIVLLGRQWTLTDSGSTSGSHVNGRQVTSCRLDDGDSIQFGRARLQFKIL